MNRQEKQSSIEELKQRFSNCVIALLTDYKGLKVNEMNQLRRALKGVDAEMKVYKNTLAKLAVRDTGMDVLNDYFQGTVALVTSKVDPVGPAKVIVNFAKEFQKPEIKAAVVSGALMNASQIDSLSKLPSREEMLAKLMGSMNAPAQNLVNVLSAIPRQLVTVLAAIRDKKS